MMTKDFEGTDLAIGDSVAYIDTYDRQLKRGIVRGFTAKNVVVAYDVAQYVYADGRIQPAYTQDVYREPRYIVKV